MFDWSAEYAYQTGQQGPTGDRDIKAAIFEGWFGVSFGENVRNRFYLGLLMLGDGDSPSKVESFIPLYGDTHERAGLADVFSVISTSGESTGTFNSFHNFTDIYLSYDVGIGGHDFYLAYHVFTATEEDPITGEDDLGTEIDLRYQTSYSDNLGFEVGLASFMPGDAIGSDADSILRFWAQARLRF